MTLPTFPRTRARVRRAVRRARRGLAGALVDLLFVAGMAAIAAGFGLIDPALGLIVGGLEAVGCAIRFERGGSS